jgi:hypothetical protein
MAGMECSGPGGSGPEHALGADTHDLHPLSEDPDRVYSMQAPAVRDIALELQSGPWKERSAAIRAP